ncbi:MAG: DUF5711 family protein [Oscillospiraceae bacterium]|nr:DUF5711 family protein [Oscillospiraceae bacterium]
MAESNNAIEQEIREEMRRARHAPKRKEKRASPWLFVLLVLLLAALGAALYAAKNGLTDADGLRSLFSYSKTESSADGKAELFRYDSDRSASYETLGKSLLIVSTTRVQLLDAAGTELWAETVSFAHPAIATGGKNAAVYDVGGKKLYLLGESGLLRDMSDETENGILSATLNASDYLALTTLKSGYRTAVTAYTPEGKRVFTFNSSERYLTEARVLSDNRALAAVSLGEADGVFASTLTFYAFDREDALRETTFSGEMALRLDSVGGSLAVLEDSRVTLFLPDGSLAGSLGYPYPYLRDVAFGGDGFAALLLSRYRSGSALRLVTFDASGETLGTLDEQREIVDVSVAGSYVAVLYSDSLTVYNADLSVHHTLEDTEFARRVSMRADGSVLLLGTSRAWLCSPG